MKIKTTLFLQLMIHFAFAQPKAKEQLTFDFENLPHLLWKFNTGSPIIGSLVIDERSVYIGSINGTLYALDKNTSTVVWKFETGGAIRSTVCLNEDKLFLVSGDGNLYCLNKTSGKMIWYFKTATGFIGDVQHDFADYYQSSPLIYNNIIYFGSGDGNVYAVNGSDGEMIWKFETGGAVHTTPALYKDKLYIGSMDGNLYTLNANTGSLIWTFKSTGHQYFPRGEMTGNPAVAKGLVFAGSRDYNFYAIDINGGYCRWMKQYPKGWALPVTVNDSVIYLGTSDDRQLFALDIKTGAVKWKADAGFNIFGGCALGITTGYFGTLMGKVFGIDLKTGTMRWTFTTDGYNTNHLHYFKPDGSYRDDIGTIIGSSENIVSLYCNVGAIFSTPAISGNLMVISSADGNVYCLKKVE